MRRSVILLIAVLLLGGCEGLAGLGGALVSTMGSGAVNAVQSKIELRTAWRTEDTRIRGIMVQAVVMQAIRKLNTGELEEGLRLFQRALTIHAGGQPKWLVQELREGE